MTATAEPVSCTDCHRRVVRSEPLWLLGKPFGPKCGKRYGLKAEKRVRVRQPKRIEVEHQPMLDGLEEEINEENRE